MGTFDNFADSPNAIRREGQEITLKFNRLSDSTARISWNIPAPANGCNSDTQAYDGIIITVSSKPANYLTTSPKDGTYYEADPTVDLDLHSADKLDNALILGAFYNDKLTTFLDITDLKVKTAYYVSAYAVDKVARYHREGVHAYSLPSGPQEPNSETDLPAVVDIGIETTNGIHPNTLTGLKEDVGYIIKTCINGIDYTLNIPGNQALDYDDLIFKINQEFIRLTEPKFSGSTPPNTGKYYVQPDDELVSLWDGYKAIDKETIFENNDPSNQPLGSYWYDFVNKILRRLEGGGYVARPFKESSYDFSDPTCYNYWFNGEKVYEWEKKLWCELPTFISEINPLLGPELDCNTFWYNTETFILYQRNIKLNSWEPTKAIYSAIDPNQISSGQFWYDQTIEQVKFFSITNLDWNILKNIVYTEKNDAGEFPNTPFANLYWFIPSEQKLLRRNPSNTAWVELDVIIYDTDPRDRNSCELWWDSENDVIYIWDIINSVWVLVSKFFQTNVDPALPQDIPLNSAWFNPSNNILTIINNPDCMVVTYVFSIDDPTLVGLEDIWFNPDTNEFKIWNGSGWQIIDVLFKDDDPFSLEIDELWFNTASMMLNKWNGSTFVEVVYSLTPLVPTIGDLWFDVDVEKLYEWNGITWIETIGIAAAKLILRNPAICKDCRSTHFNFFNFNDGVLLPLPKDIIRFYTKENGCAQNIELCTDGSQSLVFSKLTQSVIYFEAVKGFSATDSAPMYLQIGVGTDGSPDERRNLQNSIRIELGHPTITVELTKEQLDECIDNSLLMVRKWSSYAYKRNFFFLDLKPNQQIYLLKDKCTGFNKITDVNSIYRFRGGFFGRGGNDSVFGYAALQQLYSFGTFDMLSYHLVSSYVEELERMFADAIMFDWVERSRELKMYQSFFNTEKVLLDVTIERTEQDLISDRELRPWIKKWCIAEAKLKLGQIRSKFQTLPGPNGATQLNGQDLIQQAQDEMEKLTEQIQDFVYQDILGTGMRMHMIMG